MRFTFSVLIYRIWISPATINGAPFIRSLWKDEKATVVKSKRNEKPISFHISFQSCRANQSCQLGTSSVKKRQLKFQFATGTKSSYLLLPFWCMSRGVVGTCGSSGEWNFLNLVSRVWFGHSRFLKASIVMITWRQSPQISLESNKWIQLWHNTVNWVVGRLAAKLILYLTKFNEFHNFQFWFGTADELLWEPGSGDAKIKSAKQNKTKNSLFDFLNDSQIISFYLQKCRRDE